MSEMHIPLMTIFKCTRPIVFDTAVDEYPYAMKGTGFIVNFLGSYFVLTASHVVRDFEARQVRFQYHPNSSEFVPLQRVFRVRGENVDDTDQYDFLAFSIDESILDIGRFEGYIPYTLNACDSLTIFNPTASYAFRGFPTHLRETEYDLRHINMQSMLGDGRYIGPSGRQLMHILEVNRASEIGDFDGLSGSPVFQINHVGGRVSNEAFAGMILRGSATSERLEFLAHGRIIAVLTDIIKGNVVPE